MKRVNIAIIGCGAVAERYHLPALQRVPQLKVRALVDTDNDRLLKIEKKFGLEALTTTDYHEPLDRDDIDAVLILTPPHLHAQITIDAIKAKKDVFCEKPFVLTLDDALKILEILRVSNVKLMVGFNFRFIPHFAKTKKLVEEQTIGKVLTVNTHFFSRVKEWPSVSGFQFRKEMGGGALFEMGCHHIDLLRWIIGEVKAVISAKIWKSITSMNVDDNAQICLDFVNHTIGSMNVSWSATDLHRVELFGEEGMIRADLQKPYLELYLEGKTIFKHGTVKIPVGSSLGSYELELNHFADCLLRQKEPLVGAEDGSKALKIVLDCYKLAGITRST
jgi:predicted dehydrogenase